MKKFLGKIMVNHVMSWTLLILLASVIALPLPALSDELAANRLIVGIGCYQPGNTCFVALDGSTFGAGEKCAVGATTEIRWDDADQPNGKRTFAALYSAYLMGKHVNVYIHGCSKEGRPTLYYYYVHN